MNRKLGSLACAALLATIAGGTVAVDLSGWKTYRDADYGFNISYPTDVLLYPSISYDCGATNVACFYFDGQNDAGIKGTNFTGATLSVKVLRDKRTEPACNAIRTGRDPAKTETINGTVFRSAVLTDGWTSHSRRGPIYRTFHQNVCFEVATAITEVSIGAFDPGTVKQFAPAKVEKLLHAMVDTFQFEGLVKDGPGWKLRDDSLCGMLYEYPENDTVRQTVRSSNGSFDSNDLTCSEYFTHHGLRYTVAMKAGLTDNGQIESWLKSSGYSDLTKATVVMRSKVYTEYDAEPYYYIVGPANAYILSVSDPKRNVISSHGDRVLSHLLRSFKAY